MHTYIYLKGRARVKVTEEQTISIKPVLKEAKIRRRECGSLV
jgi:hypothetical protein